MDNAAKLLEIEALCENLMKSKTETGLLKMKILYFASVYENLSVSMIIEKLGIKKSNFASLTTSMVGEGLLQLKSTEIDRRCRTVCLTEKGREQLNAYKSALSKAMGACSLDVERALIVLSEYLNKIV